MPYDFSIFFSLPYLNNVIPKNNISIEEVMSPARINRDVLGVENPPESTGDVKLVLLCI